MIIPVKCDNVKIFWDVDKKKFKVFIDIMNKLYTFKEVNKNEWARTFKLWRKFDILQERGAKNAV